MVGGVGHMGGLKKPLPPGAEDAGPVIHVILPYLFDESPSFWPVKSCPLSFNVIFRINLNILQ